MSALQNERRTLRDVFGGLEAHGERTAVCVAQAGDQARWSYSRLAGDARRLGCGLISAGVGRGDTVALLAGVRPEWVVACMAVIAAGAKAVPADEQLGDKVLEHVIRDSASRFVFTTRAGWERLRRLDLQVTPLLLDAGDAEAQSWRGMLADPVKLPEVGPADVAVLFYTSGTTGPPKGVPLTHANLAFQVNRLIEADLVGDRDRVLLPLPLHHVYPFVIGLLLPLALGLPVIIPRSLTGPGIVEALREEKVTAVVGVPRLYSALCAGIESQARAKGRVAGAVFGASTRSCTWLRKRRGWRAGRYLLRPLHRQFGSNLRILACGGSQLDPELGYKLEGLGWRLAIGYGLTETAPLLTLYPPGELRMGSVGQAVPGVELRIDTAAYPADSEGGKAAGQGEIQARGPNVFGGYHNLAKATAEAFTSEGFFRTGDLGYLDADGYLYVTGRISTLIVTQGGENVQPDELESAYLRESVIREIGVFQHDERLFAVIVPEPDEIEGQANDEIEATVRAAVNRASKQLASYKRVSRYAITREALPRTRLGKIQRHLLKTRFEDVLREGKDKTERGSLAPEEMSDQDRALLENPAAWQVWMWLEARYPDVRLTPDTSLRLDLDIDSLSWLNLTMEIAQRFRIELAEQATGRIELVRDLLSEVSGHAQSQRESPRAGPLEHPEQVLDETQRRWLEPHDQGTKIAASTFYHFNRAVMRALFRVRARGLENLPAQGPFVLAPNHVSYLDPFALAAALELAQMRETYWGGWTGVAFNNRFKRAFSRMAHILPIEQERAATSSLAFGAAVLGRKQRLAWFPEGQRSRDGDLLEFKPGLGMLLDHFQTQVVPVYIAGSFQALPRGRFWPRLKPITVIFGAACDPRDLAVEGRGRQTHDRIVDALRDKVMALGASANRD